MSNTGFEPERERGIFTPRDRQFLLDELDDELDENAKRQKRYRLRQRMYHAIQDLAYLELFGLDDIGQLAEDLTEDIEPADGESKKPRAGQRINTGTRSVIKFYGEVFPPGSLEDLLTNQLRINAALDHYEETGRYGLFDVRLTIDLLEEMSVEELAEVVYESDDYGRYTFPPSGAVEVLDLHGFRRKREEPTFIPRDEMSEAAQAVLTIGEELADDSGTADIDEVVVEVARREEISEAEAREALREALHAGTCYEREEGRLKTI